MAREIHVHRAIRGKGESHELEALVATLATRQHGVVSRQQLRRIGLSEDLIDRWIAAKRLHPVHRGVYAVGHRRLSREGRYLAAVLAAGDGAVLSHRAAADLWELRARKELKIDVTVPNNRRGDRRLSIHRDVLAPGDTMTRDGIRITKPARTLLDLAGCVDENELERAIRQGVYRRLTTTASLAEAVCEGAGGRGMRKMRNALTRAGEAPGLTRSELEQDFLRFLRRHYLPLPELNVELRIGKRRIEADCVWRDQRLIIELDGRDAHDSTPAFESDRARDLALQAAGWRTGRVTSHRIRFDAAGLARQIRTLTA
jgi:very-short-patch-repair endonuclease